MNQYDISNTSPTQEGGLLYSTQEWNIVKRLRTLPDDAIILLAVTKVRGKIINLAVIGEGKREAV